MASPTVEAGSELQVALRLACERLLALQDETGWWQGELQTNVTMDAEDMLLREFLGIRRADQTERSAAWIRSQQRDDGTWSNFYGGPGDLSTTIEAYWAMRSMRRTCRWRPPTFAPPGGWRRRACSRTCGWRCSACGRGRACPRCRR